MMQSKLIHKSPKPIKHKDKANLKRFNLSKKKEHTGIA
jgi:hypothetical protein